MFGRVIFGTAIGVLTAAMSGCGGSSPLRTRANTTPSIESALARPADLHFANQPLDQALLRLAEERRIKIEIHPQVVKSWPGGKAPDVYFQVAGRPLEESLELLLDLYGLSFVVHSDHLDVIPKGSAMEFVTRVYPLIDLMSGANGPRNEAAWAEVVSAVVPGNWDAKRGGYVHAGAGALVVAQPRRVHQRIERFLADVRCLADGDEPETSRSAEASRNFKLRRALRRKSMIDLSKTSIHGLADQLRAQYQLDVAIDTKALTRDYNPWINRPNDRVENAPLAVGLTRALYPHGLSWRDENGVLVLTTRQAVEQSDAREREVRVFPLAKLVDEDRRFDATTIGELAQEFVRPRSWDRNGGECAMRVVPGGLAVSQSRDGWDEVAVCLASISHCVDPFRNSPWEEAPRTVREMDRLLDRLVSIDWRERPIVPAVTALLREQGITDVSFDHEALELAIVPGHWLPDVYGGDLEVEEDPFDDESQLVDETARPRLVAVAGMAPVTLSLDRVPLRRVLDRVLGEFQLHWRYVGDRIEIGDDDSAKLVTRCYRIPDADLRETYRSAVLALVAPYSWEKVGGPGLIRCFPGGVIVAQTSLVHAQITELLDDLKRLADPTESDYSLSDEAATDTSLSALSDLVSIDVHEQPLVQVVEKLARIHHLTGRLTVDARSLVESGCDPRMAVTLRVRGITLASVLNLIANRELNWSVKGAQIQITALDRVNCGVATRVYHLPQSNPSIAPSLIDLISHVIAPQSWDEVGGPGCMAPLPGGLAVSQTEEVQAEVQEFIERMRPLMNDRAAPLPPVFQSPSVEQIERALDSPASLDVHDVPLTQVLEQLAGAHGINLVVDAAFALPEGIADERVSLKETGLSFSSLLDKLLLPRQLDWVVRHEVLMVTDRDDAESDWKVRLYDVRPLLPPKGTLQEQVLSDLVLALLDPTGDNGLAYSAAPKPASSRIRGRSAQSWAAGDLPILCGVLPINANRRGHAALKELLFGDGAEVRRLRSLAPGMHSTTDRLAAIRCAFKDESPLVRCYAIRALSRLAPEEAASAEEDLLALVQDPASDVRVAAVAALGRFGTRSEKALSALVAIVDNSDEHVRRATLSALGNLGPKAAPAAPALAALARVPEWRGEAFAALAAIGPAALPQWIETLEPPGEQVAPACAALGQFGPAAAPAVPALLKILSGKSLNDRVAACEALARIGDRPLQNVAGAEAGRAVLGLTELFENSTISESGLKLLAALGPASVPPLIKMLNQGDRRTVTVCRALGEVGWPAASAVPALKARLDDGWPEVRAAACDALGQIGASPATVVPALVAVLQSPVNASEDAAAVRKAACLALAEFAPPKAETITALRSAKFDENPAVSQAARAALAGLGVDQ